MRMVNAHSAGGRIRAARQRAGLSQAELAAKMGMSASIVSLWEIDGREPRISMLEKIAQALEVDVADLLPVRCAPGESLSLNGYQYLAARTIGNLDSVGMERHALHGMVGEIGEVHSLYQKEYQGHTIDEKHLMKEVGDLLWFAAELCTAKGWKLADVAQANIDKLLERYPDGFEAEKSLHRKEGDI